MSPEEARRVLDAFYAQASTTDARGYARIAEAGLVIAGAPPTKIKEVIDGIVSASAE